MIALQKDFGSYMPAFFHMEVNFPYPPGLMTLYNLLKQDQATFVHEYIHYLQDVTTFFGLNNAYVYSEYLHAASQIIYAEPDNKIHLPVEIHNNYGNVELNREVNEICTGDIEQISTLFVLDIKEKYVRTKYNHPFFKSLCQIVLVLPQKKKLIFGGRAIMESMAYLVERNVEPHCKGADDYPYHSAEIVANKIYPQFANDDFRLIALCDISLNSSNPGKTFVQTLEMYKKYSLIPTTDKIYDDFYHAPCVMMGNKTKYINGFFNFAITVGERLVLYLRDPYSAPFRDAVRKMIGGGMDYRLNHRTFMVDIAKSGDLNHNSTLHTIIKRFGSPVISDNQGNFCQIPSLYFEDSQFYNFVAVEQLYKTLSDCQDCCELYSWCDYLDANGNKTVNIDDRCMNEPWKRCYDTQLCPYGMLWRHWNLGGREVVNPNAITVTY